jgi:large subunit ribosomal protein L21
VYAVIKTGGKQYKVRVGETIDVEKLAAEEGAQVRLDQVLLAANDGAIASGHPVIEGAAVTARVARQYKGPKLIVFRYKSKSRYRRRTGHRRQLTRLTIQTIEVPGWETVTAPSSPAPAAEDAPSAPESRGEGTPAGAVEESGSVARAGSRASTRASAAPESRPVPPVTGSAAPPDDVLPPINPAAQVDEVDGGALEPPPGAAIEEPPQGLPGQGSA